MATSKINAAPIIETGFETAEVAANSKADVAVTFTKSFPYAPKVAVGFYNNGSTNSDSPTRYSYQVTGATTAGFTIRLYNNTGSSRTLGCQWIAVYAP